MHGITKEVIFPIPLDMEEKGCALFDIRGKVKPFTKEPLFICANFVKHSMVGSNKQMPILHNINLLKDESMGGGIIGRMAQKGHMHEDNIFIVNQSGWGLGRNAFPKHTLYKVRKTVGGTTPITIVSPVAGNLDRARALMQEGGGK